ncbi:MAG: hypothetical protein LBF97_02000 [Elusimicrobiota bacterium]|jgi:hypothetical protein|nr:hypothetical protein [Elusimicrobiota bacterium]
MTKKYKTTYLFYKNNFFIGMATAFNLFGNFFKYNTFEKSEEVDFKAIANDWYMIGQDIKEAFFSLN